MCVCLLCVYVFPILKETRFNYIVVFKKRQCDIIGLQPLYKIKGQTLYGRPIYSSTE